MGKCKLCHNPELEKIIEWDNYPLTSVVAVHRGSTDVPVGMLVLGMCMKCGFIQLVEPDSASITYDEEYLSSNYKIEKSTDEKQTEFLEFIDGAGLEPGAKVLEIGCYDGELMTKMAVHFGFNMYGCDPSGPALEASKDSDRILPVLFNPNSYIGHKFDMVVFRNVLEHVPDPLVFLMQVSRVLKPMGKIALEVPDGEYRVCGGILGSIVPQHASYFGSETLRDVMQGSKFGAIEIEEKKGRLLAKATLHDKQDKVRSYPEQLYMCAIAGTRWNYIKAKDIRTKLDKKTEGDIWLYGANTCSKELLIAGAFPEGRIAGVIDDDSRKWGRVMVNTDIEIFPREKVPEIAGTVVICSYYSHNELYKFLVGSLPKGAKVLRLYPNIVLRKVI